jgi:hypothetical protein
MKTYTTFLLALFTTTIAFAQNPTTKPSSKKDSLKKEMKDIKLNEVTIKGKKPLIQMEIDKTIVNVGSMISSSTSNTMEVLEKTPGVTIDANGGISLNGRTGVMVLIDGRQTYMSANDLASYLKSLPGSSLDKIELIDNPSSKYDAAGNGIINIKLKKDRTAGIIGSFASGYSQGELARSNHSLNLNYNRKKLNVFSNLGYSTDKSFSLDNYDRNFYNAQDQLSSKILLLNDQRNSSKGFNSSLGLDYSLSELTTLGLQFSLNSNNRNGLLDYDSRSFNSLNQLDSSSYGNTTSEDHRTNMGLNLSLSHNYGKSGRELSFDASYLRYNGDGDQNTNNQFLYLLPSDSRIYTLKGDYIHPLKNKAKLEAGFKSSLVNNNNIANYYTLNGSSTLLDNTRSNDFNYRENINAAYLNAQKAWKYWSVQLGLRMENTNAEGKQLGNEEVAGSNFSRSYTQLFPGVAFLYKLDTINTRSLSVVLSRRINRPNYQNLNPFVFFRDKYSYTVGNPMLRTQAQYRYEVKYQHKRWLRFGLSYNHFIDVILPTTTVIDDIFYTKQDNIGQGYMVLFNTGLNVPVTEWWTANSDILLSNIGLKGQTTQSLIHFSTYIARLNLNNQLTIKGGWAAEAGAYYASRDYNGQTFTSGMYRVNAGIQKKIWNDKASIRLNFDDIFHSWVYNNGSVGLEKAQYFQSTRTDTQRIGLGFSYRFGSDTFARKSKHKDNALEEEKGRMQ